MGVFFPILGLVLLEIVVFIRIGAWLGSLATIGLLVLFAVIGLNLVREQGLKAVLTLQARMQQGMLTQDELVSSVMLGLAGVLMIIPGFVTDAMGLLLCLPAVRHGVAHYIMHQGYVQVRKRPPQSPDGAPRPADGHVLEGEFERKDPH